jgi:hypothetical protein
MNENKLTEEQRATLISIIRRVPLMDVLTSADSRARGLANLEPFLAFRDGNDQKDEEIILAITRIPFVHIKGEKEGEAFSAVVRLLRGPKA